MPALADKIAPLVPLSAERWLGEAVDRQARTMLDKGDGSRPFECGGGAGEAEGKAALAKLIGKLEVMAALADPARRQGRPPQRGQRIRVARRPYLCFPGPPRQVRNG